MEVNIPILQICSRSRNGPRERRWVSRSFVVNLRESQQKPELWFGRPCRSICHQLCCRGERNLAADQRWKSQGGPGRRHQDCQGTWKWPPRYAPSSISKVFFENKFRCQWLSQNCSKCRARLTAWFMYWYNSLLGTALPNESRYSVLWLVSSNLILCILSNVFKVTIDQAFVISKSDFQWFSRFYQELKFNY